ncbi:MAG: menaquinone biosynthesis protein [Planctomycetes bacterium]|nr:menaquinone biosynthesis protein [Planctomycetota bacterium]
MSPILRVGAPPYLVARPLIDGLDEEPGVRLVLDVPSRLVRGLRDGSLDVALASSVELFRRPGTTYIPRLCIGADGEVGSVILHARRSWGEIRSVALDTSSRSAAALVRILLDEWNPHPVEERDLPGGVDGAALGVDAFLRIGDAALFGPTPEGFEAIDLAGAWKDLTGLPFVFALWIVRPGASPDLLAPPLHRAAERGLARRARLADEAARERGADPAILRRYLLEVCRYDLDAPGMLEGLSAFRDREVARGAPIPPAEPAAQPPAGRGRSVTK